VSLRCPAARCAGPPGGLARSATSRETIASWRLDRRRCGRSSTRSSTPSSAAGWRSSSSRRCGEREAVYGSSTRRASSRDPPPELVGHRGLRLHADGRGTTCDGASRRRRSRCGRSRASQLRAGAGRRDREQLAALSQPCIARASVSRRQARQCLPPSHGARRSASSSTSGRNIVPAHAPPRASGRRSTWPPSRFAVDRVDGGATSMRRHAHVRVPHRSACVHDGEHRGHLAAQVQGTVVPPSQRRRTEPSRRRSRRRDDVPGEGASSRYQSADEVTRGAARDSRAEVGAPAQAAIRLEPRPASRPRPAACHDGSRAPVARRPRRTPDRRRRRRPASRRPRTRPAVRRTGDAATPPPRERASHRASGATGAPAASPPGPAAEPTASDDTIPRSPRWRCPDSSRRASCSSERSAAARARRHTAEVPLSTQRSPWSRSTTAARSPRRSSLTGRRNARVHEEVSEAGDDEAGRSCDRPRGADPPPDRGARTTRGSVQ